MLGLWKDVAGKKSLSLHHLIILLKLPTNWICFCLQGFFAEKTRKSQSYLALGAEKVLVQEVQLVLSWSSHVLNLCIGLPITNQWQSPRIDCVFYTLVWQVWLRRKVNWYFYDPTRSNINIKANQIKYGLNLTTYTTKKIKNK